MRVVFSRMHGAALTGSEQRRRVQSNPRARRGSDSRSPATVDVHVVVCGAYAQAQACTQWPQPREDERALLRACRNHWAESTPSVDSKIVNGHRMTGRHLHECCVRGHAWRSGSLNQARDSRKLQMLCGGIIGMLVLVWSFLSNNRTKFASHAGQWGRARAESVECSVFQCPRDSHRVCAILKLHLRDQRAGN